jgi:hypothetical protein
MHTPLTDPKFAVKSDIRPVRYGLKHCTVCLETWRVYLIN